MTGSPVPVRFTLMLPVLNEAARLPAILESIRRQRYPAEKVELLVADGGSTDDTAAIARSFGARVVPNPIGRAEPGAGLLLAQATGEVAMWLAADNAFAGEDFLEKMARPFEDPRITAAFPSLVSTAADGGTTRYFNAFSDPFNHFIYGGGTSPASYHRTYRVKRREPGYVVYDFASGPLPLIALAQGFTIRLPYRKPAGTDEDDVAPVQMLLARGCEIAYVEGAAMEHHTVNGIGDALAKFGPRFARAHDRLGISGVEPSKKLAQRIALARLRVAVLCSELRVAGICCGGRPRSRPASGVALPSLRQRGVRIRVLAPSEYRRGATPQAACLIESCRRDLRRLRSSSAPSSVRRRAVRAGPGSPCLRSCR